MHEDAWAPLAERFAGVHYASLRGQVRTYVLHENLQQFVPRPPADIVDVGGGAGHDALPLARLGHHVTIVDSSEAMLRRARDAIAEEGTDVGGRISLVRASGEAARPAIAGRWREAIAAFDSDRQVNGLDVVTRADTLEDLSARMTRHGVEQLAWFGVRLFTDGWTPDQPATDADHEVLAVELEASRRDPYRQLSRLFHYVGSRVSVPSGTSSRQAG